MKIYQLKKMNEDIENELELLRFKKASVIKRITKFRNRYCI